MESTKNTEQGKIGSTTHKTNVGETSSVASNPTASAPQRAREVASDVTSGVQTAYEQTAKAVSEAYDKTSEVVANTYEQTMTYGKENPGKLTMIAFGAGIGIGVLLASGLGGGRRRNARIAEPIVTALSQLALEFFR